MAEIQVALQSYLEQVKQQRNNAMDTAAQAWAVVEDLQQKIEGKDEEIARLNRIIEAQKLRTPEE